jgi:hypothetical protein
LIRPILQRPWKKRTAEKVATSLVQGIDIFRDVLDQTPQGNKDDARLTKTLKEHQNALEVQQEVHKLLERYTTPTKEPIYFEDARQIRAKSPTMPLS